MFVRNSSKVAMAVTRPIFSGTPGCAVRNLP